VPRQPSRGRTWRATDRTGGSLDDILDALRQQYSDIVVERLDKTHPGDDDNVYFLGINQDDTVQIDTGPRGQPPFTIEAADRVDTSDPAEALATIRARLSPTL
jgi:hypothetical protein